MKPQQPVMSNNVCLVSQGAKSVRVYLEDEVQTQHL